MQRDRGHGREALKIGVALAVALVVQLWVMTAGLHGVPNWSNFTSRQAQGFLHRQLSLIERPSAQLLALADPYDPNTNLHLRLHDAVLFEGKYYIYWGPAPAALVAAVCRLAGVCDPDFSDAWLVVPMVLGTTILTAVLMAKARAMLFPDLNPAVTAAPILSFGLGAPLLYIIARPAIYELAIFAAQVFLLAGICAAMAGLRRGGSAAWLLCAGALWAICIGCRVSMLPAVLLVVAGSFFLMHGRSGRAALAMLGPIMGMLFLLGWYNDARFHHWTDFGYHWQLAGQPQHRMTYFDTFSFRYLPLNWYEYLIQLPFIRPTFPFVRANPVMPWLTDAWPRFYMPGAMIGLIWIQPFLLLTTPGILLARPLTAEAASDHRLGRWVIAMLAAAASAGAIPILLFQSAQMRFFMDALPCLAVLAAIGYWSLLQSLHDKPRLERAARSAAALLIIAQSVLALFLAITGESDNFLSENPDLYHSLYRFFNGS